eukprot:scaffold6131_cov72-Attheya_sp.AAC.6
MFGSICSRLLKSAGESQVDRFEVAAATTNKLSSTPAPPIDLEGDSDISACLQELLSSYSYNSPCIISY